MPNRRTPLRAQRSHAGTPAKPVKELSPAISALRDRVRAALAAEQKQAFNTQENSATEIMNFCLAFGCATEVMLDPQSGRQSTPSAPSASTTSAPDSR